MLHLPTNTRVQWPLLLLWSITAARLCSADLLPGKGNCGFWVNPPRETIWKWQSEPSTRLPFKPKIPTMPKGCPGLQRGCSGCGRLLRRNSQIDPIYWTHLPFRLCWRLHCSNTHHHGGTGEPQRLAVAQWGSITEATAVDMRIFITHEHSCFSFHF